MKRIDGYSKGVPEVPEELEEESREKPVTLQVFGTQFWAALPPPSSGGTASASYSSALLLRSLMFTLDF